MSVFRLHFMNANGNGQQSEYKGPTCPFVSVPANICNLFGAMSGQAMRCYGRTPVDGCPLRRLGDVVVTSEKQMIEVPG